MVGHMSAQPNSRPNSKTAITNAASSNSGQKKLMMSTPKSARMISP
jgi:hypothetical protein